MVVTFEQLALYSLAMIGLWAVPGPVWVALVARAMAGGFRASWPLAVGVAIGDMLWPLCALLGMSWVLSQYSELLGVLRWIAAIVFIVMGVMILRAPAKAPSGNSRLTRPGLWAGITVGLAAVVGNPKAILFYMGFLPGFFPLDQIGTLDIVVIMLISGLLPMAGNLALALGMDRARALLQSPEAIRRMHLGAGILLILVGVVIPFT